ncbi:hypothetical protein SAMN05421736_103298 [Evansella caseinilytica]|uniref:Sporulation protein YjcZ n=1 Tax=Evansella caseinilytica TaxID=1503961 RepID=A0A1H3MPY0_9BACI|nr:hypothetical protein [Evansella caseinilytica]SDY78544.1 hypothetical protein SAMN05421736_103298 [Evansella caseinilytica]
MYGYGGHSCNPCYYGYGYRTPVYAAPAYPSSGSGVGIVVALLVVLFIFIIILGAAKFYR